MKNWSLIAPKKFEFVSSEPTALTPTNCVKVKIEKALVSRADYNLFLDPTKIALPRVLGRYGVGVVSKVLDENGELSKGDRVAICPAIDCGECLSCKTDGGKCERPNTLGVDIDGVYCDFVDLPSNSIYKIPDVVSFEKALFTGHISMSLNILDAIEVNKGDHVAIFSETKIGLLLAQLVSYYGAIPILIDKNEDVLDKARELGVFYTFNYETSENIVNDLFNITSGRMCEKVVYLSNSIYPLDEILGVCAYNSKLCVALSNNKNTEINLGTLVEKQIHICAVNSPKGNFPAAINLLATNKVDTTCIVGPTIKFEDIGKQFGKVCQDNLERKSVIIDID